jgi:hypothetical protein
MTSPDWDWQSIETAPECETVLTQHVDDLYPVAAFRCGDYWGRQCEGPEDSDDGTPGKWRPLLRPPTHWMPLPEPPK